MISGRDETGLSNVLESTYVKSGEKQHKVWLLKRTSWMSGLRPE